MPAFTLFANLLNIKFFFTLLFNLYYFTISNSKMLFTKIFFNNPDKIYIFQYKYDYLSYLSVYPLGALHCIISSYCLRSSVSVFYQHSYKLFLYNTYMQLLC